MSDGEVRRPALDSIIIDARPGGYRVATYRTTGNEPDSVGGGDASDVLRLVAEALGVPCPEWMPKDPA